MPIEVGIWRIGDKLERVKMSALDAEEHLEDQIAKDLSILAPQLMLIGRQVTTAFGKFIDLLAICTFRHLSSFYHYSHRLNYKRLSRQDEGFRQRSPCHPGQESLSCSALISRPRSTTSPLL
jgi:hypothetical protein